MKETVILVLAFIVALLASYATTPIAVKIAHKVGAVDVPKDNRRMHKKPTPRLGGIAIVFGFLVSVICFCRLPWEYVGIVLGGIIIMFMGAIDDCKPLPALLKFGIQILAALIPVLFGVKIEFFSSFNLFNSAPLWVLGGLAVPITVFWIVALTNAMNLIDGLDGLAAGVASISSLCLLAVSLMYSETHVALFTACLAGACFGFLPYNFNPARIFMGDSGSTFLGYILACISIEGMLKGATTVISIAVPLVVLALPLMDTAVAIIRRMINHKPIMQPDRGHLHHKLIDKGFSHKQAVLILYGISALLGAFAIVMCGFGLFRALLLLGTVGIFVLLWFLLRHAPYEHEQKEESNTENKE
ncbi:MAG: undecaprenyl/decaprenyl-phosphate alpha-N-acetylglucosaminyl 1-phosphate transferase [Clostridia bacterium]|nr:undecaprenyl/decaprenyl-phosphate alpha-N-acetylglucosaminyl 1-phosphate transferase [Clostridia bacterium]